MVCSNFHSTRVCKLCLFLFAQFIVPYRLVSDIPECAEVVEDKALIFKKSDVEDLREKLQEACDHPEMVMKMKNQAADFICKKYNWDEVVKETMKLYRRK